MKNENASDFGYSLQRLCIQAYPEISNEAREMYVIDQFINGLSKPEVRSHVQYRHPSTINSAIALAVEFEAFEETHGILRKPRFEDDIVAIQSKNPENDKQSSLDKNILDLTKLVKSLSDRMSNRSRSNSRERSSRRERSPGRNENKCWNCSLPGHFADRCPNLGN